MRSSLGFPGLYLGPAEHMETMGICKAEKILKGSLDSNPSPPVKIQTFEKQNFC